MKHASECKQQKNVFEEIIMEEVYYTAAHQQRELKMLFIYLFLLSTQHIAMPSRLKIVFESVKVQVGVSSFETRNL